MSLCVLLLDAGADPNAINDEGLTPFHVAARQGQHNSVEVLMPHVADIQLPTTNGSTALLLA